MINFIFPPGNEPDPRVRVEPKRLRLIQDLNNIEQILRVMDLHELQDLIDENTRLYPDWSKRVPPQIARLGAISLAYQNVVLFAAVEMWRERKELAFGRQPSKETGK